MRLSDLNIDTIRLYLRTPDTEEDAVIDAMCDGAISAMLSETGLTREEAEELPDITIAVLSMIADMYENRGMTAQNALRNPTVDTILTLHRKVMVI